MRVLLVSSHGADRSYGGAERYVSDLAAGLRQRGHEVALLSAFPVHDSSAAMTTALHDVDWRHSRVRRYRNHATDWAAEPWPRLTGVVRSSGADLVHTNNLPGLGTGIWEAARMLGIPVVHTIHDYHLLCPRTTLTRRDGAPCAPSALLCGLRTRRLARWAPRVRVAIGVSDHVLARHREFFPESTERRVIVAPLAPLEGPAQGPPGSALATLGYLGALSSIKGVGLLLDAAASLAGLGVAIRVAGAGPMRPDVLASEHVHYEGHVQGSGLAGFLRSCDAGVVPSLWEEPGLTYAVSDWLAAGRPVLATRRGGLPEAGARGGVEFIEGSAGGLVSAIQRLCTAAAWQRLVDAVPAIDNHADVERWIDQHEAAYEAALAGPRKAR